MVITSIRARVDRLAYLSRTYSWIADPRFWSQRADHVPNDPIFLLGTQGGGLTLLSRMLRRHEQAVSAAGGSTYWTSADELQNVFGPILPHALTGLRWKVRGDTSSTGPRSWTYATDEILPLYRKDSSDANASLAAVLYRIISYCEGRFGHVGRSRFIDKSQVFTVRLGLLNALLGHCQPRFVLVTRNPYHTVVRAASGGAADMARLASTTTWLDRVRLCAEHYANSFESARNDAERDGIPLLHVRFEDLLTAPKQHLRRVCDFVGMPYTDTLLPSPTDRFPFGTQLKRRWYPLRTDVNTAYEELIDREVVGIIEDVVGNLIGDYQYAPPNG